jgi:hypothetical protein
LPHYANLVGARTLRLVERGPAPGG